MQIRSERCNQCADAPCVAACPTGASHVGGGRHRAGRPAKCTGCKACIASCPYGARYVHPDGHVDKCTFCLHRVEKGQTPACVDGLPDASRSTFGDLARPARAQRRAGRPSPIAPHTRCAEARGRCTEPDTSASCRLRPAGGPSAGADMESQTRSSGTPTSPGSRSGSCCSPRFLVMGKGLGASGAVVPARRGRRRDPRAGRTSPERAGLQRGPRSAARRSTTGSSSRCSACSSAAWSVPTRRGGSARR